MKEFIVTNDRACSVHNINPDSKFSRDTLNHGNAELRQILGISGSYNDEPLIYVSAQNASSLVEHYGFTHLTRGRNSLEVCDEIADSVSQSFGFCKQRKLGVVRVYVIAVPPLNSSYDFRQWSIDSSSRKENLASLKAYLMGEEGQHLMRPVRRNLKIVPGKYALRR